MSLGISQADVLLQLKQYMKGQYSYDNITTFKKLIAEANSDLGLLKLPDIFLSEVPMVADMKIQEFQRKMMRAIDYLREQEKELILEVENYKNFSSFKNKLKIKALRTNISKMKSGDYLKSELSYEQQKNIEIIDKNIEDLIPDEEKKVLSVVLGPDQVDLSNFPLDVENKSIEDLKEMGMDVVTSLDLEMFNDGSLRSEDLTEEKRENLKILAELLSSEKNMNRVK